MSNNQFNRLVSNITTNGVQAPLTVTQHEGRLYILDGHNRAAAALRAGVGEVPIRQVELPYGAYRTADDLTYTPGGY